MAKKKEELTPVYGEGDTGCWIDGAFGDDHRREKLAGLVAPFDAELAEELRGPGSDDLSEEDDAIDRLNDQAVEEGYLFVFDSGDLLLVKEDEYEG